MWKILHRDNGIYSALNKKGNSEISGEIDGIPKHSKWGNLHSERGHVFHLQILASHFDVYIYIGMRN